MMMVSMLTPGLISEAASSPNPFVYLFTILFVVTMSGIGWIVRNLYTDMKKDKEKADSASIEREKRLHEIDEQHRQESRERELLLQDQIRKSNESFEKLGDTIDKISESQIKMTETQKETFEAVQNLNQTVQILNYDMRDIKTRLEDVEKEHKK